MTLRNLFQGARARAKRFGLPFTITVDDIKIPTVCPLLGIPIETGRGKIIPGSPSLDRVRPEDGYVPGNVWVISHRVNTIKSDASVEELELVAAGLRRREKEHMKV